MVEAIENDPKKKYQLPDDWPYKDARELFLQPDVRSAEDPECDFKWDAPDVEGLVKFLVGEKGFNEDRVRSGAQKLQKNVKTAKQASLGEKDSLKRKHEEKAAEAKKKKKEEAKTKKESKAKVHLNS